MDAYHMPYGCGTWPAWWQNGPNWPYGGEIDILEGVNAFTQNQVSLHTGSGCRMPGNQNDNQYGSLTTGWFDSYNCASYETGNEGCGVRDGSGAASYGKAFNDVGGGVYARKLAQVEGICMGLTSRSRLAKDRYLGLLLPKSQHPRRHQRRPARPKQLGRANGKLPSRQLQPLPILLQPL